MIDFSSDSDEDKAVKEILSQAADMVVLEQVAAINCASFTDSDLPSHLEARFQKLKSLPSNSSKPLSPPKGHSNVSQNSPGSESKSHFPEIPSRKSPSPSSDSHSLKIPSCKSPSSSSFSSRSVSVSPPARRGCFLCSPNKEGSRKGKKGSDVEIHWAKCEEFVADLKKSQRKMMKNAMKGEEKMMRKAEKIINWANEASARMRENATDKFH